MSSPYDDGNGRMLAWVLAGVVAGALAVGLIWAIQARGGSDDGSAGQAAKSSNLSNLSTDDPEPTGDPDTSRLERCREVFDAQDGALEAGAASMDQWEVHIGAMNKLVVGAISLQQARAFWSQTRIGAMNRLERFAVARTHYDQRTARCPAPPQSERVGTDMRLCAEAVAARNRVLHRAAVALDTWRMHVHHMEMLRDGEMSPAEASRLWLQSWRQGDREVKAYRAAGKEAGAVGTTC
jgi:hypothetical protein